MMRLRIAIAIETDDTSYFFLLSEYPVLVIL
jgi:hypothetical protein